jgi:aminoglycoside phosphotransferase (APT) family kinase protein
VTTLEAEQAVLRAACDHAGLDAAAARPISRHATSVYLLDDQIVARIHRSSDDRGAANTAAAVTRWLVEQGYPATSPASDPVDLDDVTVTFWLYYAQDGRTPPGADHLGQLLRQLHDLPQPPVALHNYQPLERLGTALEQTGAALDATERRWLSDRRGELIAQYNALQSELGIGWVHGDAYPGNTLWDGDRAIVGDWDEVAIAPRELDLVNTHQGARMGRSAGERQAFTDAYGWDVTAWPGWPVLREMRDLHTLGAYIQRADAGDTNAAGELRHRVQTLMSGDVRARWHSA